jgi:hypothetical protein
LHVNAEVGAAPLRYKSDRRLCNRVASAGGNCLVAYALAGRGQPVVRAGQTCERTGSTGATGVPRISSDGLVPSDKNT